MVISKLISPDKRPFVIEIRRSQDEVTTAFHNTCFIYCPTLYPTSRTGSLSTDCLVALPMLASIQFLIPFANFVLGQSCQAPSRLLLTADTIPFSIVSTCSWTYTGGRFVFIGQAYTRYSEDFISNSLLLRLSLCSNFPIALYTYCARSPEDTCSYYKPSTKNVSRSCIRFSYFYAPIRHPKPFYGRRIWESSRICFG